MLGVVLIQIGRLSESLISTQKSVELNPLDSEAHNNLGITLEKLDRLNEAEVSYKKAITLEPDFAEAHSNLGVILRALGRLEEAEIFLKKAIELKSDYFKDIYFAERPPNERLVNKKLDQNLVMVLHRSLKKNTPIKITNPENNISLITNVFGLGKFMKAKVVYVVVFGEWIEMHMS